MNKIIAQKWTVWMQAGEIKLPHLIEILLHPAAASSKAAAEALIVSQLFWKYPPF